jgi:BirA family biotin operon repressor/biotin-[acetyl-CoA-carboxylase] ligase
VTPDIRRALLDALADGPVRGPTFADEHGVSRAAVWKHVEALRDAGFGIESGQAGYEVTTVPEYGAPAIEYGLDAPYRVEYHDRIGSTNDRARELAAAGEADVAVVADAQTGGRGRLGRAWAAPAGGVYVSLAIRPDVPPAHAPAFTLAAAVAVAEACEAVGVDPAIKWPNDLLVGDDERKLAGVLTEMEGEADRVTWMVVGVGLNANVDAGALPGGATSLRALVGDVDRRRVVQRLLAAFADLTDDLGAVLPRWRERAATLGRRVRVETAGGVVEGEAVDVEFPGTLVVRTGRGEKRVHAGDCEHLRPADGA